MTVDILEVASDEFQKLNNEVQDQFLQIIKALSLDKQLPRSEFKKVSGHKLYELRVRHKGKQFRALGQHVKGNLIIITFFDKQRQKLSLQDIKRAEKRISFFIKSNM